jgi:hypothetical protein
VNGKSLLQRSGICKGGIKVGERTSFSEQVSANVKEKPARQGNNIIINNESGCGNRRRAR